MCVTCDSNGEAAFFGSGSSIRRISPLLARRSAGVEWGSGELTTTLGLLCEWIAALYGAAT